MRIPTPLRHLTIIAALALLAACAGGPATLTPEATKRIHTVGIASFAARDLGRQYVGLTVFGNEYEHEDISAWRVDAAYEGQIAETLTRLYGMQAQAMGDAVRDLPVPKVSRGTPDEEGSASIVKALCERQVLDAVVLVAPAMSNDAIGSTNQSLAGAATYARLAGFGGNHSTLHLIADVELFDCKTRALMASRRVGIWNEGKFTLPLKPVATSVSRAKMAKWTPGMRDLIRKDLESLPIQSWDSTFKALVGPGVAR